MKTNMKLNRFFLCLMIAAGLLFSCSDGEDGAIGPIGPQGEQGPEGPQGPQGEEGTANVIFSEWIPRNFIVPGAAEENIQGLEVFNDSELNVNTDVVLVFGRRSEGEGSFSVYQLPFLFDAQDEYYGFGLFDVTGGTGLQVRVNTLDGGTNLFTFFSDFRYVIIPGGTAANSAAQQNFQGEAYQLDFEKMSYEEVLERFGGSEQ
ncbi:hypothetical protein GTQ40_08410 [Flavobacteriaceae bacterium R38]|nr:hypothetical protein [Flavobacteriaceae bacterium R38]